MVLRTFVPYAGRDLRRRGELHGSLRAATARILAVWVPAALSAAALGGVAYAAAWPSSRLWGPGFHRLPGGTNEIALTFDDGPASGTPDFLDALDALNVRATFFVCGRNVVRSPDIARAIVDAGHAIGNHTYSHPKLPICSPLRVRRELVRTQHAISEATGVLPTLFRPPYGLRSPALRGLLPELGLVCVHWTVIGNDWKRDAAEIASRVLRRVRKGAIICLHDGCGTDARCDRSQTLEAVREIVPRLKDRGFRFRPLSAVHGGGRNPPAEDPGRPTGRSSRRQ